MRKNIYELPYITGGGVFRGKEDGAGLLSRSPLISMKGGQRRSDNGGDAP